MPRLDSIRLRRGDADEWADVNPVLDDGEPGIARDIGVLKLGDGVTPWNDLNGYALLPDTQLWVDAELARVAGTGLIDGGVVTGQGTDTLHVAGGVGRVVSFADPLDPVVNRVAWDDTDIAVASLTDNARSWVHIDADGDVRIDHAEPDATDHRARLYLARVVRRGPTLVAVTSIATPAQSTAMQIRDLMDAVGPIKRRLWVEAIPGTLQVRLLGGYVIQHGVTPAVVDNPHRIDVADVAPLEFRHIDRRNTQGVSTDTLTPALWNPSGTTVVEQRARYEHVFELWLFAGSGNARMLYPQHEYRTLVEARRLLRTDHVEIPRGFTEDAIRLAWIGVDTDATDLADPDQAFVINTDQFGN